MDLPRVSLRLFVYSFGNNVVLNLGCVVRCRLCGNREKRSKRNHIKLQHAEYFASWKKCRSDGCSSGFSTKSKRLTHERYSCQYNKSERPRSNVRNVESYAWEIVDIQFPHFTRVCVCVCVCMCVCV